MARPSSITTSMWFTLRAETADIQYIEKRWPIRWAGTIGDGGTSDGLEQLIIRGQWMPFNVCQGSKRRGGLKNQQIRTEYLEEVHRTTGNRYWIRTDPELAEHLEKTQI